MTRGNTKDYSFGKKNNWRRAMWNEVLRRTNGRERRELILYLAGPDDIDRAIAIDKGVPPQNLIAIDRDASNVARVRAGGASAIDGDVVDLLWSWPNTQPVCAVLLDFCGGLTWNVTGVYDAFQRPALRRAVGMVNFQRGRDAFTNPMRQTLADAGLLQPLWVSSGDHFDLVTDDVKHRAYQFMLFHAFDTVQAAMGLGSALNLGNTGRGQVACEYPEQDSEGRPEPEFAALVLRAFFGMRPKLFTYRSGVLTFDSAVFESLSRYIPDDLNDPDAASHAAACYVPALGRKISAMLAVRTRRRLHAS